MDRKLIVGAAFAVALGVGLGYRLGSGAWPIFSSFKKAVGTEATHAESPAPGSSKRVLYWKDPDGGADFSASPKKTADGRDYLPVYEDQERDFKGAKAPAKKGDRKIIYYRN